MHGKNQRAAIYIWRIWCSADPRSQLFGVSLNGRLESQFPTILTPAIASASVQFSEPQLTKNEPSHTDTLALQPGKHKPQELQQQLRWKRQHQLTKSVGVQTFLCAHCRVLQSKTTRASTTIGQLGNILAPCNNYGKQQRERLHLRSIP